MDSDKGRTNSSCSQRADGVLANGALSDERYGSGMEMNLTANLQQAAANWIYTVKEGKRRLREIVTLVSSTVRDWSEVIGGGTSRTAWLEDKRQRMMDVLWELEEGPNPQLDDLLDWQLADSLMGDCYGIYEEGSDLCDKGAICTSGVVFVSAATSLIGHQEEEEHGKLGRVLGHVAAFFNDVEAPTPNDPAVLPKVATPADLRDDEVARQANLKNIPRARVMKPHAVDGLSSLDNSDDGEDLIWRGKGKNKKVVEVVDGGKDKAQMGVDDDEEDIEESDEDDENFTLQLPRASDMSSNDNELDRPRDVTPRIGGTTVLREPLWASKMETKKRTGECGTGAPVLEGGGNVNSVTSAVVPASHGHALLNKPGVNMNAAVVVHKKDNSERTAATAPPRSGALALVSKAGNDNGPAEKMLKVTTVPSLIARRTVNSEVTTAAHNSTGAPQLNSRTMAVAVAPHSPVPHSGLKTDKAKPGITIDDAGEASKATGIPLQKGGRTHIPQTTALALAPQSRAPDANTTIDAAAAKPDAIHRQGQVTNQHGATSPDGSPHPHVSLGPQMGDNLPADTLRFPPARTPQPSPSRWSRQAWRR
ncbi:hypothetical protein CBR_g2881 [Chara braunii]|uniref:Uncharacterized protein n=1 Tax=Chara braunii TaxID=69332 RepID=A0A388KEA3_CHABU|nr:hypothetical protein CBR_g2881 [Chara braunii]|eukprot:GBG68337.1 hypothetical protein CBR_g2881 [Chara braunii]